jgi:hypothetical protein
MAYTKEQIIAKILPGQVVKRRKEIVWGNIVSAIATANDTQKDRIIANLKNKNYPLVGKILSSIIFTSLEDK